jgi:hypothetical protein
MSDSAWARHRAAADMFINNTVDLQHQLLHMFDKLSELRDIAIHSSMGDSQNDHATAAKIYLVALMDDIKAATEKSMLMEDEAKAYKENL